MKWPGLNTENYYIFDDGRIWSKYKKGFVSQWKDRYGYLTVTVLVNGKKTHIPIHRAVEYNFLDTSLRKNFKDPTVDHIDSNKENNRYTNLRYLERGDNARRGKHYKNTYNHSKLTPEDVHLICKLITYNWSVKEILKYFDISDATIYQIKKKNAWAWIGSLYF